jgi:lipopolysaccharide export system permease protein
MLSGRELDNSEERALVRRTVEGLRVLAICLFVASLAIFPTGNRRRFSAPIELVALGAAFVERGVTSYLKLPGPIDLTAGPLLLLLVALVILAIRFRVFVPMRIRRQPA